MKTPTFFSFIPLLVVLLAFLTNVAEGRRNDFRLSAPTKRAPTSTYAEMPNAERLRRGLPPTMPKRLYSPSRVRPRDANPSYVPTPHSGHIKVVRASDNSVLGYVGSQYNSPFPSSYAWYGVTPSNIPGLTVTFTPPASGVFDIEVLTPGRDYPFLGLTGSAMPSPTDPDPYQQNLGRMTQTNPTLPGSEPADVLNGRWPYSLYSESAVWQYDENTKELTAIWVSENSAVYPVHFYNFFGVGAHVDGIAFTTNTLTYNDLLDLFLVPQNNQEKIRFFFETI